MNDPQLPTYRLTCPKCKYWRDIFFDELPPTICNKCRVILSKHVINQKSKNGEKKVLEGSVAPAKLAERGI